MTASVYRKPTNTDRYIHFNSHHHPRVLTRVIRNLRDRAKNICTKSTRNNELARLNKIFQANGYPKSTINKVLYSKHQPQSPPTQTEPEQKPKIFFTPYVRGISEKIKRACHQLGIRAVFKSQNTLRQTLMRAKERRPEEAKRGVVYEVPYAGCSHVYIGETGRSLNDRLKEHRYAVKTGNMNNGIAAHAWNNKHHVDWDAAKVRTCEEHL